MVVETSRSPSSSCTVRMSAPAGRSRFVVYDDADGDLSLGFDDYDWNIHASDLASLYRLPVPEAIRRYVDPLLDDRVVIAVWSALGEVQNVWISGYPDRDAAEKAEGETIE